MLFSALLAKNRWLGVTNEGGAASLSQGDAFKS
jgi:hypothetical protein